MRKPNVEAVKKLNERHLYNLTTVWPSPDFAPKAKILEHICRIYRDEFTPVSFYVPFTTLDYCSLSTLYKVEEEIVNQILMIPSVDEMLS